MYMIQTEEKESERYDIMVVLLYAKGKLLPYYIYAYLFIYLFVYLYKLNVNNVCNFGSIWIGHITVNRRH